ncbi:uncharacterized protein LOC127136492 [Lathyrus oleraceus]|uniref:uncharacterized protein LOC127136492 n=1 Tax=Pisum sativum TaxID=3888 RepID=UPI0021CF7EB1|nr:uncharacterized protein LOC127136492 [Pisum sativum]
MEFERVICDLRASVSLMHLSMYKMLDMGDMKPTNVSSQLADRSVKYPIERDIIDVKRVKFTFEVGEDKIEFIFTKLLKKHYLRDSCCLISLLNGCVQENALEPPSITKLEESLLHGTKIKMVDTEDKGYEEALG